jgi:endonuclease YncB( thermonuclease family)
MITLAITTGSNVEHVASPTYRVDHVADGDTITLTNGQRVRLVQIDTPEVYFGVECYGERASAMTKRLLPEGTRVRGCPGSPRLSSGRAPTMCPSTTQARGRQRLRLWPR